MIDPRVKALCDEFEVRIVPKSAYPGPGETRAPATINRILRKYGEEHGRLALSTLRETANNHVLLDEVGLWCASDMIRARPDVVEKQAGEWLALWDKMPVGQLQAIAQTVSGVLPVRYVLDGMLLERIQGRFGDRFSEPDLFDDRRRIA